MKEKNKREKKEEAGPLRLEKISSYNATVIELGDHPRTLFICFGASSEPESITLLKVFPKAELKPLVLGPNFYYPVIEVRKVSYNRKECLLLMSWQRAMIIESKPSSAPLVKEFIDRLLQSTRIS